MWTRNCVRKCGAQHSGPWKSSERLLVAIGPSPFLKVSFAGHDVRQGARLSWVAVHVDAGAVLGDADRDRVSKQLALAASSVRR